MCKQDVFGKRDSPPVQSGNTASGRLCHSGKLTESHHLCHETWLTLGEDLVSLLSPPCRPRRMRPLVRVGRAAGPGETSCVRRVGRGLEHRLGSGVSLSLLLAPPGGHRLGREGNRQDHGELAKPSAEVPKAVVPTL